MYTFGFAAVMIGGILSGSGLITLLASLIAEDESAVTVIGAVMLIVGFILIILGAVIMTYSNIKESANEDIQAKLVRERRKILVKDFPHIFINNKEVGLNTLKLVHDNLELRSNDGQDYGELVLDGVTEDEMHFSVITPSTFYAKYILKEVDKNNENFK